MAELCTLWRPAVVGFLRSRAGEAAAEDLTQGFFLHFIETGMAGKADPGRGRFRSFLFASLRRWSIDQERALHAERRGGGQRPRTDHQDDRLGDDSPSAPCNA